MKKRSLVGILLVTMFFSVISTSCSSDDDDITWLDSVKDGRTFSIGTAIRLYYIDDKGNDLIDPANLSTLPIVCIDKAEKPREPSDFNFNTGWYNDGQDAIYYDEEEKLYYYNPKCLGDTRYPSYTFYVYFKGEFDKMDMKYQYSKTNTNDVWGTKIDSWKYNGVHIYSTYGKEKRKVFVHKVNGTTVVNNKK